MTEQASARDEDEPARVERRGRPRRFDAEVERSLLLDAAIRVLSTNGHAATSVADVLAEAGLSTRSFYRHFDSKDELVAAVVRGEAEAVQRSLERAIAKADGPIEALSVWLDRVLDLFFDPRKASRTALYASPEVVRSSRIPEELPELHDMVSAPLAAVLRDGHGAGLLRSQNPELDAATIFGLVSVVAHEPVSRKRGRKAVRAHIVRYAWPALGLSAGE